MVLFGVVQHFPHTYCIGSHDWDSRNTASLHTIIPYWDLAGSYTDSHNQPQTTRTQLNLVRFSSNLRITNNSYVGMMQADAFSPVHIKLEQKLRNFLLIQEITWIYTSAVWTLINGWKCYSCLSQLMLVLLIFTFLQKKWIGIEITWILWHSVNSILSHRSKHIHTVYKVERCITCKLSKLYFGEHNYGDSIFAYCFINFKSNVIIDQE